jgi:DnaK suppressor protein
MKKKELDKFRKLLLSERDGIVQHLMELEGASVNQLAQGGGDSVDIASLEITQSAIQKLGNREKKLLNKIDYALKKIDDGDYGVCEKCGEDIAPGRLEARPVTQYCIDCKTELESNERRYSDSEEDEEDSWGEGERVDDSN